MAAQCCHPPILPPLRRLGNRRTRLRVGGIRAKIVSSSSGLSKGRSRIVIRILIVDDHVVVRQGLRIFLGLDPDLEIVAEAADGAEAVELARKHRPDVVLMDLLMPVMSGVEATATIRRELPDTEVLALTSVIEDTAVVEALRAGAIGYLLKNTDAPQLTGIFDFGRCHRNSREILPSLERGLNYFFSPILPWLGDYLEVACITFR